MDKEQVQLYGTILGGIFSLAALSYILIQHKKSQASYAKQDALLQLNMSRVKQINTMDARLRNLELAQCSNPYVRENPQLTHLLNCPQIQRQAAPPGPPPPPQVQQQQQQGVMPAAYVSAAASQNLPPMPNYGFFGDGPAGTGSGATMMMGAFATDSPGGMVPVPFQK